MKGFFLSALAVLVLGALVGTGAQCTDDTGRIEDQNEAAEHEGPGGYFGAGERDVFDLRPGDCLTLTALLASEIASAEVVPCMSTRAAARVTNLFLVERTSGPYPGDSYFENQWLVGCDLDATTGIVPTQESWSMGDRTIICIEEYY